MSDDLDVRAQEREAQRLALIKRLCLLQRDIADRAIGHGHTLDCFCRQTDNPDTPLTPMWNWANSGAAVDFIEQAVTEKLQRITDARDTARASLRRHVARIAAHVGVTADDLSEAMANDYEAPW